MSSLHSGHRKKLRERMRDSGEAAFQDHELLELLLSYAIPRVNVNPLAHELIDHFGSFSAVMNAEYKELEILPGMGEASATIFLLVRALGKRLDMSEYGRNPILRTAKSAASYAADLFQNRRTEAFYALFLDPHNRLLNAHLVSEGTPNETAVFPRKIVETALLHKASSVILTHNHPSGDVRPSADDISLTKKMGQAFALLNMRLNEHIIVGTKTAFAMISERVYDLNKLAGSPESLPGRMANPHELIAQIRALDDESLGILVEGIFDHDNEAE